MGADEELDDLDSFTPSELVLLTKVQARLRGWAARRHRARDLKARAEAAGGPWKLFGLDPSEKLLVQFSATLNTSLDPGTLYV